MAKFLLNYHGGKLSDTPEGQAKVMEAWNTWFGQLGSALVDGGNPVGATKTRVVSIFDHGITDNAVAIGGAIMSLLIIIVIVFVPFLQNGFSTGPLDGIYGQIWPITILYGG